MQRFADETSLHGIKEVWYASRFGRLFWLVVFSFCVVVMAIQLKGVFEGYLSETVGTTTTYTSKGSVVDIPSVYYCNPRWKANPTSLEHLIECSENFAKDMEQRKTPMPLVEQQKEFRSQCYSTFVQASLSEEIINTIINPDWIENMYAYHFLSPKACPEGYAAEMARLAETNPDLYDKLLHFETDVFELRMQGLDNHLAMTSEVLDNTVAMSKEVIDSALVDTKEFLDNTVEQAKEVLESGVKKATELAGEATAAAQKALDDTAAALAATKDELTESIGVVIDTAALTKEMLVESVDNVAEAAEATKLLANEAKADAEAVVGKALEGVKGLIVDLNVQGKVSQAGEEMQSKVDSVESTADQATSKANKAIEAAKGRLKRRKREIGFLDGLHKSLKCNVQSVRNKQGIKSANLSTIGWRKKRETNMHNPVALQQMQTWIIQLIGHIENNFNGSLKNYVEANSVIQKGDMSLPAHGVISRRLNLSVVASLAEKIQMDHYREGKVAVNMNGVCWEINPGAKPRTVQETQMHDYSHYIVHFGAFVHDIGVLTKKTKTSGDVTDIAKLPKKMPDINLDSIIKDVSALAFSKKGKSTTPKDYNFKLEEAIYFTTKEHPRASCDGTFRRPYETDLFISQQNTPVPFFNNPIRLEGSQSLAHIKFSTKKIYAVNRKGYRCRENWTLLDKAHCIEEKRFRETRGPHCRQYLPASRHYNEIPITSHLCYHAPMKQLKDIILDQEPTNSFFNNISAGAETLVDWMKRYSVDDIDCPTPCVETEYITSISYSASDDGICDEALGHILLQDKYDNLQKEKNVTTQFLKQLQLEKFVKLNRKWSDPPRPCTKVIISQTEESGFVSEEYPLHTIADLASNLGGTLGLWIGASVISFIQCLYFLCIERLVTIKSQPEDLEVPVAPTVWNKN